MRRLLSTVLAVSTLAVAGCGGGDSESALDKAFSYVPKDADFAAAVETDLEGDQFERLNSLLNEFVFADSVRDQLRDQTEQMFEGDFGEDIRPLLGNPAAFGGVSRPEGGSQAVVALQVGDKDKLDALIERTNARELGEESGATIYRISNGVFGVDDDVVVLADEEEQVAAAIERANGDDHFDEETFDSALEDLPDDALLRLYLDLEAVLEADPDTADARKIKWVAALRELGLTVSARERALDLDFRATTDDGGLADEDLPIAPGDEAPDVIDRPGEVGLGIRDLAHIVTFAENAAQAIDPAGFGDYAQAKETINRQLDVDLDEDLIGQLTGDTSASVAPDGAFGVRAELDDPQAFERTLERVSDVLPNFAEGAGFGRVSLTKPRGGDGFYVLTGETGGTVVFGVANDVLVVASDRARAAELAEAEPQQVEGAEGSVVLGADAEELANRLISQLGPLFGLPDIGGFGAGLVTSPLGELNGSMSASPEALRGKLTLTVD